MPEIPEIYLHPGEWELVRRPTVFKTVLGSCVGITFRVPRLGIGAMCHPMLPHHAGPSAAIRNGTAVGRYVDLIVKELAGAIDRLGASREETEVKLLGGADVLTSDRAGATVGRMNADTAVRALEAEGFSLAASFLGGNGGVFVQFHTGTGDVLLRHLNHMSTATPARI